VQLDKERIERYLDQIATETTDLQLIIGKSDDEILRDRHIIKGLKYSTIVIAEAIASTWQYILAKRHNVVVDGYTEVFKKSKEHQVLTSELLDRLQPFIAFRNMLVHHYWRVNDTVFLKNLRDGQEDFRLFIRDIKKQIERTLTQVTNRNV